MCTYYRKGNKSFAEECGLENPNGIEDRWASKGSNCINDGRATFKTLFYVGSSFNLHEYFHLIHCRFWSNWMLHYFPRLICPSPVTHLISSVDILFSSSSPHQMFSSFSMFVSLSPSLTKCAPSPNSCPNNWVDAKDTSTSKVQSSKIFSRGLLVVMKPPTTNGPGRCLKTKNMMDSRTCHHDHLFMFCNWSGRPLHRRRLVLRRVSHLWRVGDDCSSLCRWCQLLWHHGWEKDIRTFVLKQMGSSNLCKK